MHWSFYTAIVVLGATGIHFFAKLAKGTMDPFLGLFYTMGAGFLFAFAALPFAQESLFKTPLLSKGVLFYSLVGISSAIAYIGIIHMFKAGGLISLATPLARLGPVFLAVLLGVFVFQEILKPTQIMGLVLAVIAVVLVTR